MDKFSLIDGEASKMLFVQIRFEAGYVAAGDLDILFRKNIRGAVNHLLEKLRGKKLDIIGNVCSFLDDKRSILTLNF